MKIKNPPPPKNVPSGVILLLFILLFQISCNPPVEPTLEEPQSFITELGGPEVNPFSLDNMKIALENVLARQSKSGKVSVVLPSTTHNYVRFAPQDTEQLVLLHNLGYDLYDIPLDQEITTQGEFYQDPSLPSTAITYQYSLVPANYALPTTVPYSILYQVFLFDENAGDEQDPEWDPWTPDPGDGYCYDEYNQAYICGTNPRIYLREKLVPTETLYAKATKELLKAGINLKELYNEAMRISGHEDEQIEDGISSGRTNKTMGVTPSGVVRVVDNSAGNILIPVKNVTVKTRRWFKLGFAQTNASGFFTINKSYRSKAHIILKFRNDNITIRGISGALKIWEYAQALEKEVGLFSEAQLQNVTINLGFSTNADSYAGLQWAAAHCVNTHFDMKQFCRNNSLPGPYNSMNIWISSAVTSAAAAPMLRAVANTSVASNAITYLLPGVGPAVKTIVQNWLPDVTLRLQNISGTTRNATDLTGTFFHEFAHSQHYDKVGNNYWAAEIAYIVVNNGYGDKTTPGSGRVAVVESWGNLIGGTFNRTRYSSIPAIANFERDFLENQRRSDTQSIRNISSGGITIFEGWIPWGMLHDLTDTGEPTLTSINDQVNGYNLNGIFKGFHSGSDNVQTLRAAILANNNNNQATQVNALVSSYGW